MYSNFDFFIVKGLLATYSSAMAGIDNTGSVTTELTPGAKEKIKKLLDESKTLSILFTGKTGVGKSSLANALVGREVSPEGETLNPETMNVFNYNADIAGVNVTIWDCPGLQDGTANEAEYLEKMATKCKELDLVLYCTRMDDTRIRDEDYETITTLTRAFGESIWENAIFTLTFANRVRKAVRSRSTATPVNQKDYFISRLSQWESKLKEALEKAGVSRDTVSNMVVLPVGYQDDLHLPDRDNWLSTFWLECLKRINKRATLALLKISSDRLLQGDDTSTSEMGLLCQSNIKDLQDALYGVSSMAAGCVVGAATGSVVLPVVGTAVGGVLGIAVPLVIHMIKEQNEAKKKT